MRKPNRSSMHPNAFGGRLLFLIDNVFCCYGINGIGANLGDWKNF